MRGSSADTRASRAFCSSLIPWREPDPRLDVRILVLGDVSAVFGRANVRVTKVGPPRPNGYAWRACLKAKPMHSSGSHAGWRRWRLPVCRGPSNVAGRIERGCIRWCAGYCDAFRTLSTCMASGMARIRRAKRDPAAIIGFSKPMYVPAERRTVIASVTAKSAGNDQSTRI
jgi:hypothetical protein